MAGSRHSSLTTLARTWARVWNAPSRRLGLQATSPAAFWLARLGQRNSPWLDLYSFVVSIFIPIYYGLLLAVVLELVHVSWVLLRTPWGVGAESLGRAGLLGGLVVLAAHLLAALVQGTRGLVTSLYDVVQETVPGVVLSRERYEALYRLVGEVGRQVAAPLPDEIWVGHHPECYVFEQRQFSVRPQRRLILVIGLPHLEVMSVAELRVILAHELAHFGRRDTTLGIFIFRFLESLRRLTEDLGRRWWRWIDPLYWFSLAYFYLFRRFSAPIQRYQELRADALSAEAYGGRLAAHTLLKEWLVSSQFETEAMRYAVSPQEGEENLFRSFQWGWRDFSEAGHEYLERRLAEEEQALPWDSHPKVQDRIAVMRQYPDRPEADGRPARELLPDLAVLEAQLQEHLLRE